MPYKDKEKALENQRKRNKTYYEKHKDERREFNKLKNKKYYQENRDKLCEQSREWSKNNRDKKLNHCYTYRVKWEQKRKAHSLLQKYVSSGKINKLPCEICGLLKVEAHHTDYSKPLIVMWLCDKHHKEIHKKI